MPGSPSANTQAILLLTAPLITGRGTGEMELLSPAEYLRLARSLHAHNRSPADLLGHEAEGLLVECASGLSVERIQRLLSRGLLLSQAVDRWHSRSIWVMSRADPGYPARLRKRLKDVSPPLLYGSGDVALLNTGGLAVVGSRNVEDELLSFARGVGALAATAGRTTISGGARGIDQAAMSGCAEAGGNVVGVLADRLERAVLTRENRNLLREHRLTLVSPYDPSAGFHIGHAMARNKLIYALADAALVVNADLNRGGTWAGAVEQLERFRFVPVFVRLNGSGRSGPEALRRGGAIPWPDPATAEELARVMFHGTTAGTDMAGAAAQLTLFVGETATNEYAADVRGGEGRKDEPESSSEDVPADMRLQLQSLETPMSLDEIRTMLGVTRPMALRWLAQLMIEGVIEKSKKPARYKSVQPDRGSAVEGG